MSPEVAAIIAAIIGGPLMWGLYKFDKRNTKQHGEAVSLIKEVRDNVSHVQRDVNKVDAKLDIYIAEHEAKHATEQ